MDGGSGDRRDSRLQPSEPTASLWRTLLFWWLLLFVVQQAQRLYLLIRTVPREPPSPSVLGMTLLTGIRADLVTAGLGIVLALLIALAGAAVMAGRRADMSVVAARVVRRVGAALAALFLVVLTVDFGYFQYSGQRMDAVFFEYVSDVLAQVDSGSVGHSQVGRQTAAEAGDLGKWIGPIAGYLALMLGAIATWCWLFKRVVCPVLAAWETKRPWRVGGALLLAIGIGVSGMHPAGPDSIQQAAIAQSTYYALAQSALWYVGAAVDQTIWMPAAAPPRVLAAMPESRAYPMAREALLPGTSFPYARYPLVHPEDPRESRLARRPNVLVVFVEALDRRYLGRTYDGVPGTPFLDRLRGDSVYFENFLTNGTRTFHGLFSSLCSALPRGGSVAAIKARYANDYLCLPAILRRAGYQTRMVIGQNRDVSHSRLGLFMARNGMDELVDDSAFPSGTPRMGLGITDGALFARLRDEIAELRGRGRPYFLTTLTTGTHHPFAVPDVHPDVVALRAQSDHYIAALRCLDFELERFFVGLQRDGLLDDTVVLVLGDHGRHERVDLRAPDHQSGHFMSPLAVWLAPSLRAAVHYRPRAVPTLVSQADLAPTILGLAGLTPRLSSFIGRDVGCALSADCLGDRVVYLSASKEDTAGIADREGFWFYSITHGTLEHSDLGQRRPPEHWAAGDPAAGDRVQRILALYVTANLLIERNQLWSWKELGGRL